MNFWHEVGEGLLISLNAIRANKMRSSLTMLGIVIGILSVTLMATAIEGLNRAVDKSMSVFGSKVLYVQKWAWVDNDDWWKFRNRKNLQVEYVKYITDHTTLIDAVAPTVNTSRDVKNGSRLMMAVTITGTTSSYQEASGATLADGRFFSSEESDGGRPVCCIGAVVAEQLFMNLDPIGQTIDIGGNPFKVLAVYEKQGGIFGALADNRIFIPIDAFLTRFGSRHDISINARVAANADLEDAKEELRGIMRTARQLKPGQEDDFSINQQDLLTQLFDGLIATVGAVGLFITGLSLFVGGIGIMNIMYVSVTERTREIGVRKALGARRRTILFQFLVEAAIICLIGGLVGIALAYPLSLLLNQLISTAMPVSIVFISIFISITVGVVSGFLPANKASKMDPVDALRYE
jgi:putative ABC transport system permease protein